VVGVDRVVSPFTTHVGLYRGPGHTMASAAPVRPSIGEFLSMNPLCRATGVRS
jgi:hypothetical protein